MKFYGQALADLNRYIAVAPRAMDADKIRGIIRSIERDMAWQNWAGATRQTAAFGSEVASRASTCRATVRRTHS